MCKVIFTEYELPKKIMSDSDSNFVLYKFKTFYKSLTIEQAFSVIVPLPEQWTRRSMHQIYKMHTKNVLMQKVIYT